MDRADKMLIFNALNTYARTVETQANTAMINENYGKEIALRNEAKRIRRVMNEWDNAVVAEPCGTVRI